MDEIRQINPSDYYAKWLSQEEILHWFSLCDAFWLHDGNPKKPHAELTSGMCSNGFFDCMRVLRHPNLAEILAYQLYKRIMGVIGASAFPEWVIGSAYAAITFSYEVAGFFRAVHGFVEKDPNDPKGKRMLWQRMKIPAGAYVMQVEELVTTSRTVEEVRRAVEEGNGESVKFLPFVGVLVHRPPKLPAGYDDFKVVALIETEIWTADPVDCPLCKAGSPRYRPKTYWTELTGKK